ncbi:MAG: M23 family metallopeptidase [Methyloceanibacter sp.]|uniref:M23 family metallopeptidase n=1 Tax=Methyloceanibacter sp. TaxID=1965321 RepID=UPI003D6C93E9
MLKRAFLLFALTAGPASAFELEMPVACTPGTDCFIQQYVDRDAGPEARDYVCGGETYDGHKGTDIRLRTTADVAKGVAILAAAPGVVAGLRDGMADHLLRNEEDQAAVADKECGNGVLIDHGDGWATQYCHMRNGSVAVKKGDKVKAGDKLGEIGYSGAAAFPHVEIVVTKDDATVDPFLADMAAACDTNEEALWTQSARAKLLYEPGVLLGSGVTDHPVTLEELEAGAPLPQPKRDTPVVAYLWGINLQKGDFVHVLLRQDGTMLAENTETLDRNKAQFMLFAGKKAPQGGWPAGSYVGEIKVMRDGKPVLSETATLTFE